MGREQHLKVESGRPAKRLREGPIWAGIWPQGATPKCLTTPSAAVATSKDAERPKPTPVTAALWSVKLATVDQPLVS